MIEFLHLALPFFTNLAQKGILEYPIFALSLTTNSSGTLTLGLSTQLISIVDVWQEPCILGAIDSSVVTNVSQVGWNKVAQFPPFSAENNISSYLQWTIPLSGISVTTSRYFMRVWLNFTLKVNGTQFTPLPTYTNNSQNHSLALFDVWVAAICVYWVFAHLLSYHKWSIRYLWSIPRCMFHLLSVVSWILRLLSGISFVCND